MTVGVQRHMTLHPHSHTKTKQRKEKQNDEKQHSKNIFLSPCE